MKHVLGEKFWKMMQDPYNENATLSLDPKGYYEEMRDYAAGELEKITAPKVRATFHLPPDLCEQARDAVYWTPGLTMAGLCESALRTELANLGRKRGGPFPKRKAELKRGRPPNCAVKKLEKRTGPLAD